MEFSDFTAILARWCEQRPLTPLDCWIDDANARLAVLGNGVRISLDLLDPYDGTDPQRLEAMLTQGGASVACACAGALAVDPDSRCVVLTTWLADPCGPDDLLERLEHLANQRAALLSLLQTSLRHATALPSARASLNTWQPGV
ncbi:MULTISPECIES: type III secretion protein [unclassified Pseudomonas]|uniref:type III secretion protein n=1 Tax=unclassified Pseudomonas TaxID=196821 RepID=UPI000D3B5E28|nr:MULTISPECIES: type III secretion protein [unclassified Pseudomonas]RAU41495.1 type III secretion protein [Pseudomonas sp. RIT 409]RAU53318.1 type III secretion protein [Pseudomonas sp. RIT 412]